MFARVYHVVYQQVPNMAGRSRSRQHVRCPYVKVDGTVCGIFTPSPSWDFCARHIEYQGAKLLVETPERVSVTIELPRFPVPLRGWSRSQWEACRLLICEVVLEPEMPDV